MRKHRGEEDVDLAAVREFLSTAEGVRKSQVMNILTSVENVRHNVQHLTITEAFVAHKHEQDTFDRSAILARLEQRMRGRASELVKQYFESLKENTDG